MNNNKDIKTKKRTKKINKNKKSIITYSIISESAKDLFYKVYNIENENLEEAIYEKIEVYSDYYILRINKENDKYKVIIIKYELINRPPAHYWEGKIYNIKTFNNINELQKYIDRLYE